MNAALHVCRYEELEQQLAAKEAEAAAPNLWDDPSSAQAVVRAISVLKEDVGQLRRFRGLVEDLHTAMELFDLEVCLVICVGGDCVDHAVFSTLW